VTLLGEPITIGPHEHPTKLCGITWNACVALPDHQTQILQCAPSKMRIIGGRQRIENFVRKRRTVIPRITRSKAVRSDDLVVWNTSLSGALCLWDFAYSCPKIKMSRYVKRPIEKYLVIWGRSSRPCDAKSQVYIQERFEFSQISAYWKLDHVDWHSRQWWIEAIWSLWCQAIIQKLYVYIKKTFWASKLQKKTSYTVEPRFTYSSIYILSIYVLLILNVLLYIRTKIRFTYFT
jgi:hypothetical protein